MSCIFVAYFVPGIVDGLSELLFLLFSVVILVELVEKRCIW